MTTDPVFGAVIVAAGSGSRMRGLDKLFTGVAGRPLLAHAIAPFQASPAFQRIVLVVSAENVARGRAIAGEWGLSKVRDVVRGGDRRQDSVRLGLEALGECDYVAVHDGARPLVDARLIARGLEAVRETGAAVPAVPLADTVKEVGRDALVVRTVDRTRLWAVQTPQFFRYDLLLRAHRDHPVAVTDDAALLEAMGLPVKIFPGDKRNVKVTTPEDLELVRNMLGVSAEPAAMEYTGSGVMAYGGPAFMVGWGIDTRVDLEELDKWIRGRERTMPLSDEEKERLREIEMLRAEVQREAMSRMESPFQGPVSGKCESCSADIHFGWRFCAQCGAPTRGTCPRCQAPLPANARFCPHCGGRTT